MPTLEHRQTKTLKELSRLPMLQVSPYFSIGRGALVITEMKAIAGLDYAVNGSGQGYVGVVFFNGSTFVDAQNVPFDMADATDSPSLISAAESAINAYAATNSYSLSGIFWTYVNVAGLSNAPQAAIANAPADATTNYNVITTLLGTLTSAVNTANTKQNDIATKLNTLLAELRTLGLISV